MSGKGSKRRPAAVPHDEVARRWERAFGGKPKPADPPEDPMRFIKPEPFVERAREVNERAKREKYGT